MLLYLIIIDNNMYVSQRIRKAAKAFKESLKKDKKEAKAETTNKKTTDKKDTPAKAKEDKSKKEIKK